MYDPKHSLFFAWKEIIRHWIILWRISRINHKKGIPYLSQKQGMQMMKDNALFEKKLNSYMFSLLAIFFTGMLISFLGSLPLGSLNVSAMQLAIAENTKNAIRFSLGVALVEILYVRLSLTGIGWVIAHRQWFYTLEWITVFCL